jgi:hypothetical protein
MKPRNQIIFLLSVLILVSIIAYGQSVPQLINYQGRLTDSSGQPVDGDTVDITFTFYGSETGDTALLAVVQEDVPVIKGIYNVLIGSGAITPGTENSLAHVFQKRKDVWMGVKVNTDPEMSPRSRITSVPYSLATDKDFLTQFMGTFTSTRDFDGDGRFKFPLGTDCNDWLPTVYAGAPEICDGIDNQCPGDPGYRIVDEGCSGATWWTIDDVYPTAGSTDSISMGIAGHTVDLALFGVQDYGSYYGYNRVIDFGIGNFCSYLPGIGYIEETNSLDDDPFVVVLKIKNGPASPLDLSTLIGEHPWVRLIDNTGEVVDVAIPGDTIPPNYTLLLYVANNGSTYYMVPDQGGGEHSIDLRSTGPWFGPCTLGDEWPFPPYCPTVKPPDAWTDPAAP